MNLAPRHDAQGEPAMGLGLSSVTSGEPTKGSPMKHRGAKTASRASGEDSSILSSQADDPGPSGPGSPADVRLVAMTRAERDWIARAGTLAATHCWPGPARALASVLRRWDEGVTPHWGAR